MEVFDDGFEHAFSTEGIWMAAGDEELWIGYSHNLLAIILPVVGFCIALHLACHFGSNLKPFDLSQRNRALYFNRVLNANYSLAATGAAAWWYVGSGEAGATRENLFDFYPRADSLTTVSLGFYVYDLLFLWHNWGTVGPVAKSQLFRSTIMAAITGMSKVYPCVLSMWVWQWLARVELANFFVATRFLLCHSRAKLTHTVYNSLAMLAFGGIQLVVNAGLVWFTISWVIENEIYSLALPYELDRYNYYYIAAVPGGTVALMYIHFQQFKRVASDASAMVTNVNKKVPAMQGIDIW